MFQGINGLRKHTNIGIIAKNIFQMIFVDQIGSNLSKNHKNRPKGGEKIVVSHSKLTQ